MLTDTELRALAEAHSPTMSEDGWDRVCEACDTDWPCPEWDKAFTFDAILVLLDRIERAEAALGVERIAAALLPLFKEYDGPENQVIHSWRCRYPDTYGHGPCTCLADMCADIAADLRAKLLGETKTDD
jgi:hypothetical protein